MWKSRVSAALVASMVLGSSATAGSTGGSVVPLDIAKQVVDKFTGLRRPTRSSSAFDHWTYNVALFTASSCWEAASSGRKRALEVTPTTQGGFLAPTEAQLPDLCGSIAKFGIRPLCTHSSVWSTTEEFRDPSLPADFLYFKDDEKPAVKGVLGCFLNNERVQLQMFPVDFVAEWEHQPSRQRYFDRRVTNPTIMISGVVAYRPSSGVDERQHPYRELRTGVLVHNGQIASGTDLPRD